MKDGGYSETSVKP